jgi:hypothetical protein
MGDAECPHCKSITQYQTVKNLFDEDIYTINCHVCHTYSTSRDKVHFYVLVLNNGDDIDNE